LILQLSIEGSEWILGIGIAFGMAFVFTLITIQDVSVFLAFLTMFVGFSVWAELLPVWSLILCFIVLTISLYVQIKERSGGV